MEWGERPCAASETAPIFYLCAGFLNKSRLCVSHSLERVAPEGSPIAFIRWRPWQGAFHSVGSVSNVGDCVWGFIQAAERRGVSGHGPLGHSQTPNP